MHRAVAFIAHGSDFSKGEKDVETRPLKPFERKIDWAMTQCFLFF